MSAARRTTTTVVLSVLALLLTACGTSSDEDEHADHPDSASKPGASTTSPHRDGHTGRAAPVKRKPLRPGERRVTVRMPETYTPSAPTGTGTDDYRCFLLDPKLSDDQFITGFNVLPGNPDVVHHVILFRVPVDVVPDAEKMDADTPGQGWTCFGASGLRTSEAGIDDAPWVGAWAPGGSEQVYGKGLGEELGKGSRLVMQVHYNLLTGKEPDRSAAELRLAPATDDITALQTQLLPAPVELPCRPEHADGPLCDRDAALADVKKRFGDEAGSTADLLHFLCGPVSAGAVQTCERPLQRPETVRAVAGHMHLLGKSIKVEVNAGRSDHRTLLDIPVWDFDDQGSRPIKPARLQPGDRIKVTCTHSQELRDRLPAFEGQPDRYVMWADGTTDEMCLGILLVTRP
jgi:Copper type II ascorbate-dependent monooxygenase, N-terminal domain